MLFHYELLILGTVVPAKLSLSFKLLVEYKAAYSSLEASETVAFVGQWFSHVSTTF